MFYARNTKNQRNCIKLIDEKEGRTFIIFDTETTGLDPKKDYIVELAAQKYRIAYGVPQLIEEINLYIRPPFEMDEKVVGIHHITNEFLKKYPEEPDVFGEIEEFFGQFPILLGYNVDFDIGMLNAMYERQGKNRVVPEIVLDIQEMGYDLLRGKEFPDHKLGTLVSALGLDVGLKFHNALDDTTATYRLLMYCHEEYKKKAQTNAKKERIHVNTMYYWKGMRKEQTGMWLKTNLGKMYYSNFQKTWCSTEIDLSTVDIDTLENDIVFRTGLSMKEFGRLTEKRFKDLKQSCRERGIFL